MNIERIKELAEEADFVVLEDNESGSLVEWEHNYDKELLKFVELIVKECMDQVRDEVQYITDYDKADQVVNVVKKHFGVE